MGLISAKKAKAEAGKISHSNDTKIILYTIYYKKVLDDATFQRFSKFRVIRKRLAEEEAIPAYAIFKDEELAALAKLEELSLSNMKTVKGIGEKKVEKYGKYFTATEQNAKSELFD